MRTFAKIVFLNLVSFAAFGSGAGYDKELVREASVDQSTLRNSTAEKCLVDLVKTIEFPHPPGKNVVTIKYPFIFSDTLK